MEYVLILFFWMLQTEKLYTKVLPYPHTSKEAFEQNMRMPVGPECNPTTATGLLNRPEVSFSEQFLVNLAFFIFPLLSIMLVPLFKVIKNNIRTSFLFE